MFDFLIKYPIFTEEIKKFLASMLECSVNKILMITSEELDSLKITEEELNKLCCLCVYSKIVGDASWLLNLYRISGTDAEIRNKIITTSQLKKIACYIPNDNFNGYLLTGESETPLQVYENECISEDGIKYFFNKASTD